MIGKLYGVAETAALAVLERLGVTSGGTYTPGGSSPSAEGWTDEVATLSALNAALASGDGKRILVTTTLALTSTETISLPTTGEVSIGRAPGVQITHASATAIFTLASGSCKLRLIDSNDSEDKPWLLANGGGNIFASSGALRVQWDSIAVVLGGSSTFGGSSSITLIGANTIITGANAATVLQFSGYLGCVTHQGGGISARVDVDGHIGHLQAEATYRAYTANNSATTYAIKVGTQIGGKARVDAISGAGLIDGTLVLASLASSIGRVSTLGRIAAESHASISNSGLVTHVVIPSTVRSGRIENAYIDVGLVYETSAGPIELVNCAIEGANTAISGSRTIVRGGRIVSGHSLTAASGSKVILDAVEIAGTLTLDSGAAARVTSAVGSGTLTNNDTISIVTLSENAAWDTTPSTRRYGDPTLDALLDNHVAYWSGKSSPCPNRAPLAACNAGGNLYSVTGNVLSVSDAFDLVDPTDQMMALLNGWAPGYGPFTMRLDIDLDVASAGEENIIGDGTANFSLNLFSSGALRIYVGATFYDTSSGAITTGAGNQRVTIERTGTTLKIYVNGVQVLTTTDSSLIAPINYFYLGGVGASAIDGKVKKITLLNTGIADATEQLWDTYSLVGAGA